MTLSAHPGFAARQPAIVTVLAVTLALITADPAHGAGCGAALPLDGGCAEYINTVRVNADGGLILNVK
ncbi:MAG TPA: hypothetical protein VES73_10755, partial [Lamprocystis sp. (in: g-proteobacteria)]|nr:hypothetical protein [Lamprocystis sp. (in: g-proteobacteria)]